MKRIASQQIQLFILLSFFLFLTTSASVSLYDSAAPISPQINITSLRTSLEDDDLAIPLLISQQCDYNSQVECKQDYQQLISPCQGLYCGRNIKSLAKDGSGICTSCPSGYKTDGWICVPCKETVDLYSIYYLVFFCLYLLIPSLVCIDVFVKSAGFRIVFYICALLENALAVLVTLLILNPTFNIKFCGVERFSDWYTGLNNPADGKNCDTERVYPLFSFVLINLAFVTGFTLLFRVPLFQLLYRRFPAEEKSDKQTTMHTYFYSLYSILIYYPIYGFVFFILCGFLYYILPYLSIIILAALDIVHAYFIFDKREKESVPKRILVFLLRDILFAMSIFGIFAFFYSYKMNYLFLILCFGAPLLWQAFSAIVVLVIAARIRKLMNE